MTGSINSIRRYFLLKRFAAQRACEDIELVWRHKQEAVSGSPLPDSFPLRERLSAVGYSTSEDLDGADEAELRQQGFSGPEASNILQAFSAL